MEQFLLKSLIYSLLFILSFSTGLKAQKEAEPITARNAVYLELGGNGAYYSFNYERILHQKGAFKLAARAGVSVVPVNIQSQRYMGTLVPLEVTALYGRSKHHLEAGAGVSPYLFPYSDYNSWEQEYDGYKPGVIIPFRLGYRYQKPEGGFFFRVGYTPFVEHIRRLIYQVSFNWLHGGISFGKSF